MPTLDLLLSLFVACVDFGIAFYVLKKNPNRTLNRVFCAFACGMGALCLGMILLIETRQFFFDKLVFLGGYLATAGLVLLGKTFPEGRPIEKKFWIIFLPLIFLLIATPFNLIIKGMNVRPDGAVEPINGPLIPYFVAIIGAYVLLGFSLFFRNYRRLQGIPKLQMQYLAFGAFIFSSALFVFNVALPALGIPDYTLLGPNASIIFTLLTAYAIVRHELLDIRLAIQKGAIYLTLVILISGFYLGAVFLIGHAAGQEFNVSLISAGITTLVGIFGVPYVERYFRKITDRFFFKEKYDYSEALRALSETLHRTLDQGEIIRESAKNLKTILRAENVDFVLGDDHVSGETARLQVPIELEGVFIGKIFLGEKRSGDPYSEEDRKLLQTFSYQVAIALERSKLYERVKQYSMELEDKVRERTEELQFLQEEQRQMMIEISHNLQTPLTVVKGELGFLKDQLPGNTHFTAFEKSIDGISKFIYDLLKLAKLEMSREESLKEPLDISAVLEELMEYFGVVAKEKNIELASSIKPGVRVLISKDKFEDLITNLLSNAMKYMSDSRLKKITVTLRRQGENAEIKIADTGIGIKPEDLSKIFHRFYRVSDNKASHIKGTGLGLAICKRIVEKASGTIGVESTFGKGTTFILRLPEYKD